MPYAYNTYVPGYLPLRYDPVMDVQRRGIDVQSPANSPAAAYPQIDPNSQTMFNQGKSPEYEMKSKFGYVGLNPRYRAFSDTVQSIGAFFANRKTQQEAKDYQRLQSNPLLQLPANPNTSQQSLYGTPEYKGGGWIKKAINPAHKGWCTPLSNPHCTGHRRALALRFKHHKLEEGGEPEPKAPPLVNTLGHKANMSDLISYTLVNQGDQATRKQQRNILYTNASQQYGDSAAKKLINDLLIYSKRPEVQGYSPEQKIRNYYSINSNDKDVQEVKNQFKNFGLTGPSGLYSTSPDLNVQNQSMAKLQQGGDPGKPYGNRYVSFKYGDPSTMRQTLTIDLLNKSKINSPNERGFVNSYNAINAFGDRSVLTDEQIPAQYLTGKNKNNFAIGKDSVYVAPDVTKNDVHIPRKEGGPTSDKAKEMLRDGTAQGHKLTDKQKRYFGWIAGGKKAEGGFAEDDDELQDLKDDLENKLSELNNKPATSQDEPEAQQEPDESQEEQFNAPQDQGLGEAYLNQSSAGPGEDDNPEEEPNPVEPVRPGATPIAGQYGKSMVDAFKNGIANVEGANYNEKNKNSSAFGKYQIVDATREGIRKQFFSNINKQDFDRAYKTDPKFQERVMDVYSQHLLGSYPDPHQAAIVYFLGEGNASKVNQPAYRPNKYNATVGQYLNKFNQGYHFKEGGEYNLTDVQIDQLRKQGYQIEII